MSEHFGHWDGRKLHAETFAAQVKSYPIGTPLRFTVGPVINRKSTPQNRYLHQLFRIAAKELSALGTQWTPEEVKSHCKAAKLYPMEDRTLPGGEIVQVAKDTAPMDKEDTAATIDRVLNYFAELGIILPLPGEQLEL